MGCKDSQVLLDHKVSHIHNRGGCTKKCHHITTLFMIILHSSYIVLHIACSGLS